MGKNYKESLRKAQEKVRYFIGLGLFALGLLFLTYLAGLQRGFNDALFKETNSTPISSAIMAAAMELDEASLITSQTEGAPTSQEEENNCCVLNNCVLIDSSNPRGVQGDGFSPTAYSAWEELGRPPTVVFYPKAYPNNSKILKAPSELPDLVHNGDRICTVPQQ